MLELIWFLVNMIFVTMVIAFMFINRSLLEARRNGDSALVQKVRIRRNVAGLVAVTAFAGMIIAFLANMHVNG